MSGARSAALLPPLGDQPRDDIGRQHDTVHPHAPQHTPTRQPARPRTAPVQRIEQPGEAGHRPSGHEGAEAVSPNQAIFGATPIRLTRPAPDPYRPLDPARLRGIRHPRHRNRETSPSGDRGTLTFAGLVRQNQRDRDSMISTLKPEHCYPTVTPNLAPTAAVAAIARAPQSVTLAGRRERHLRRQRRRLIGRAPRGR